jgi:hypothetical protein
MPCTWSYPVYIPHSEGGLEQAAAVGDGSSIYVRWRRAFQTSPTYKIAYNIYYSSLKDDIFAEGVKVVSIDPAIFSTEILDFPPGDAHYFAVRATEYDPLWMNLSLLPDAGTSKFYPESILAQNLLSSDSIIYLSEIDDFPSFGVLQIGSELIRYQIKDGYNSFVSGLTRGFLGTEVQNHDIDGYNGLFYYDPIVYFWKGLEEPNEVVQQETPNFAYPNYPGTLTDGYKDAIDLFSTDLSASDESQANFPPLDHSGWHRTDPVALLMGECVGSYFGGEQYCADGYDGVGRQLRGQSIIDKSHQTQEELLEITSNKVVLFKRKFTNKRCYCYSANFEQPEHRCPKCFGAGTVVGYEQFFNPRRGDGKILVRFGPTQEDFRRNEAGMESVFIPDCWTLVFPAINDSDFIIRFSEAGEEEYRYEILNVTRNVLIQEFSGRQVFTAHRVPKTDPIYTVKYFKDSSFFPSKLSTTIGMTPGYIPPHLHTVTISEKINSVMQINQNTSTVEHHNHQVINGIVEEALEHTHDLIL